MGKRKYRLTGMVADVLGCGYKQGLVRSTSWAFGVANDGGCRVNYMWVIGQTAYQLEEVVGGR